MFKVSQPPASEDQMVALLADFDGRLPSGYCQFLRDSNGAEGGPNDWAGDSLRFLASTEITSFNEGYDVWSSLPDLLCFASDGGDYAFAFDRSASSDPEAWSVVRKPLGTPFVEDLELVARSFSEWVESQFSYDVA